MKETPPVPSEQARAYFAFIADRPAWQAAEPDIHALRAEARELVLSLCGEPDDVASVEDVQPDGVPARLYRPAGGEPDVLVYFHGGGWALQDLDCIDTLMRRLASEAACAVLAVDYRLAPEHPYPAAVEDCWAATRWAAERFERVAVGGDSAGGNLAAAIAHRARDAGLELSLQLLVYPAVDARTEPAFYGDFVERYRDFGGIPGYGAAIREGGRYFFDLYFPDASRREERDASPLLADSFESVAPALIVTAEHDIVRGGAEEYARRLQAAGVPTQLLNYEGQVHGFFQMLGLMDDGADAVARAGAALRRAFGRT